MFDTTPEMQKMMQETTPSERVMMGFSMFETFRESIIQSIRENNPGISELDLKKELFLRLYGDEFTAEETEAFFKHLENYHRSLPAQPSLERSVEK